MLVVAIDHGETFARRMEAWGLRPDEEREARLCIARLCVAPAVEAVVLDQGTVGDPRLNIASHMIWLGGPDFAPADAANVANSVAVLVGSDDFPPVRTVKLGLKIDDSTDIDLLSKFCAQLDDLSTDHQRFVLEPLFEGCEEARRREVVAALAAAGDRLRFKCDFGSGDRWLEILAAEVKGRWFLRSFGASFDSFTRQARRAMAHGCNGVIVGTALWADIGGRLSAGDEAAADEFRRRVQVLSMICGRSTP